MRPPPYPTVATARREAGLDGIRALVAWIAEEHPPGVSTLTAAVIALGAAPERARHAVDSLRRSAREAGRPLPPYPPGTAAGHPSHATRPRRGEGKKRAKTPSQKALRENRTEGVDSATRRP